MAFAFNIPGMVSFASYVVVTATVAASGCIATNPVEFSEAENYPPSVVSQPTAEYPLREIGELDLDVPTEDEVPLDVVIRDPNVDQTLEYRIFLNSPTPPGAETPVAFGSIPPQAGSVERPETFNIPNNLLVPGVCNKIELVVVGDFASFVEPRRPLEEGDFDDRVWWIEVTNADNPVIEVECR